jgi:hypothetical protein
VDDCGAGPSQKRRGDETNAFAGTGRRKAENMLGAIMAEIMVVQSAEQHAEP